MSNRPQSPSRHIVLTSHPRGDDAPQVIWGASDPRRRGPIIASHGDNGTRNAIGVHSGSYAIYRSLAVAAGRLDPVHVPDLTDTAPAAPIGPHPQWGDADRIVSLDPFGHLVAEAFADWLAQGCDIRPTIAVTRAHISMPEIKEAVREGRVVPDGDIVTEAGEVRVIKAAIDPVWYLPGIAHRLGIEENELRHNLFEHSGGMFPELVTRRDLKVFLPPIGGTTVYIIGDPAALADPSREVACRVHDECNGSDVFGSDICTCRPYLAYGVEYCVDTAQQGGVGLIVYNRKEGRALGEVTKFLVYNARKRQQGGDRAETYFERTECVAGVTDQRFQEFMPDVLHWLGIDRIDHLVSMSDMKRDSITRQGIAVARQVALPDDLIPDDAKVEMAAKIADGYFTDEPPAEAETLGRVKGRALND